MEPWVSTGGEHHDLTLDDIFEGCLDRIIPSTLASDVIVKEQTYSDCWNAVLRWIRTNTQEGRAVNVAGLGVISHRTYKLGIRIPVFTLSSKFRTHYGLQSADGRKLHHKGAPVARMNHEQVAHMARVDKEIFTVIIANIFDQMGQLMQAGHSLTLDFDVGSLICKNYVVSFVFTQRPERSPHVKSRERTVSKKANGPYGWGGGIATKQPSGTQFSLSSAQGLSGNFNLQSSAKPMKTPQRPHGPSSSTIRTGGVNRRAMQVMQSGAAGRAKAGAGVPPQSPYDGVDFEPGSVQPRLAYSTRGFAPMPEDPVLSNANESIAGESEWVAKPLLDSHSRTRAAALDGERFPRKVSDKIGSNYSLSASLLTIDSRSKKGIRYELTRDPLLAKSARTARDFSSVEPDEQNPFGLSASLSKFESQSARKAKAPASTWRQDGGGFSADAALTGKRRKDPPAVPTMPSLHNQVHSMAGMGLAGNESERGSSRAEQEIEATTKLANKDTTKARYLHFLKHGIDSSVLAAMKEEWVVNVLELLPTLPEEPDSNIEKLLRRVLQEMKGDYVFSVKKGMLDYILKSPFEQNRLGIEEIPEEFTPEGWGWGGGKSVADTPEFWRRNVEVAHSCITEKLLCYDSYMVEVLALWQNYKHLRLVNLPTTDKAAQKSGWTPQTIHSFKQTQLQHAQSVTRTLLEDWHPACAAIFEKAMGEQGTFPIPAERHEQYFEALAVLMSNQLRELVMASMEELVEFFTRFETEHSVVLGSRSAENSASPSASSASFFSGRQLNPYSSKDTCTWRPAFKVMLEVKDGGGNLSHQPPCIVFDTTPQEIKNDVMQVFDNIVECMRSVQRVEYKFSMPFVQTDQYQHGSRRELFTVQHSESVITSAQGHILQILEQNFLAAKRELHIYDQYNLILAEGAQVDQFVAAGTNADQGLAEYHQYIQRFSKCREEVEANAPVDIPVTLIQVECVNLNNQLCALAQAHVNKLNHAIAHDTITRNLSLVKSYKVISQKMAKKPTESEELVDLEQYLEDVRSTEKPDLDSGVREVKDRLEFLFDHGYEVTDEVLNPTGLTFKWVHDIGPILKQCDDMLSTSRMTIEGRLDKDTAKFEDHLQTMIEHVMTFDSKADMKQLWDYVDELEKLREEVDQARQRVEQTNEEEERLGKPTTEFEKVQEIVKALDPYDKLWSTIADYQRKSQSWNKGPMFNLDAEEVEKDLQTMFRTVFKLGKTLQTNAPEVSKVAGNVKDKLDEFKPNVPLIGALCNKGLRERHWEVISKIVGFPISPDEHSSLTRFIDLGVDKYLPQLEAVSEAASKEWSIEKTLIKMKTEWEPLKFELLPYKSSGTYVLSAAPLEEVTALLDDHIVKSQTMRNSPDARPFFDDIVAWDTTLNTLQDIIDEWTKCQGTWLYLEPIFSSEDIMKQMPKEGRAFKEVDAQYRSILNLVAKNPVCTAAASLPGILESLKDSNTVLEEIQKGLNAYLELKRLYFPRFFFLSNDELLEILAETKDPLRVQPHLKKCFDGLNELEFTESMTIVAMMSPEKEKVAFCETLDPASAQGAVEVWLLDVERIMMASLKSVCIEAIADYPLKARTDWTVNWPGQLVLNVSQMYWTREFETVCREDGNPGVAQYLNKLNQQLQDIVACVRGDLSNLARKTLSALTVIDVHARDTMAMLVDKQVSDTGDFEWASQLRYYWEDDTLQVKMINSVLEYGYEYIGNSGRLVITPLTDRCYRTLMGALHLQYGGAPEGPAGTGKTETVKDLSKALARQCVVFNCSDQLDYLAMAKFFKGLASSGAWACFDEFNRIKLEVLSVIAQQITQIQQAIAKRLVKFEFEGTTISLRWTANAFITMNPGYAGRAELPDNLKVLFRTVAMMVPDYAMIAEIILYSFGYERAKHCATKITATYKLCSEQLSSQDHYDYGMRAVMAVIRAAGNLKRKYGEENEEILMLRAINDVNLAKFLSHDIPLFKGITSDLFPGISLPEPDYDALVAAIRVNVEKFKLQGVDNFVEKIIQLYEMVVVRHGLMVVGQPFSGKTANIRCLAGALTVLCERGQMPCAFGDHELATDLILLNPKSIGMGQLYGCFDDVSHEWTDGVLAIQYRQAANANDGRRKWVVFDGPVDAIWIENMNTVLDDNKKLCLNSGEIIQMSAEMTMVFEPMDLAVASPATVSRCGMVYMEPHKLGWRPLVHSWYGTLPETITGSSREKVKAHLNELFEWMIDPLLFFVRRECTEMVPTGEMFMVNSLTHIFSSLCDEFQDADAGSVVAGMAEKDVLNWVDAIFQFSVVWALGGTLNSSSREKFDEQFRAIVAGTVDSAKPLHKISLVIPATGTGGGGKGGDVFDYTFEKKGKGKWRKWEDTLDKSFSIAPDARFSSILVPTSDTARYTFLMKHLTAHQQQVLLVGPTGTGKTIDLHDYLMSLHADKYTVLETQFSAQTSANQTQNIVDSKMDKRRKGVFGPPPGKRAIVFVDDLNMPEVEEYGAQPPLELLRQFMDHGGWYDLQEMTFRNLIDLQFCAAMGPPGGGRNHITPRLIRHFTVIGMTEVSSGVLTRIYSTLMNWFMGASGMNPDIAKLSRGIVDGTLFVYQSAIEHLLPTPNKSHYLFNLRDYARVVQGVCMVKAAQIGTDKKKFVRLWLHECARVIFDRLTDDDDRSWFVDTAREATGKFFGAKFDDVCAHLVPDTQKNKEVSQKNFRSLLWGDYKIAGADPKLYDEVDDLAAIRKTIDEYLDEYNTTATKPMNLVMFMFAIEHVSRLARILKIPGGNALLVGVGGSGRQSLTRLATYMAEFECFQIEISKSYGKNEWYEDMKKCLIKAGGEGKPTVFLFADTQIQHESFVEDINNILNSGEIPNLFASDEKAQIVDLVRAAAKADGKKFETTGAFYSYFLARVRENLHIALCFSPIGDAFRTRLRQFPSLVNCCTIDWFAEWPDDALESVAKKFLEDVDFASDSVRQGSMEMCIEFHMSTIRSSTKFLTELRRHYYVTPTSYLELISTFKTLLKQKREEVLRAKKRYEVGLEKLVSTEQSVEGMQVELTDLQPVLVTTTKEVEEMMVKVENEQVGAEKIRKVVLGEEKIAQGKADDANKIKTECEADLSEAMPILHAALAALDTLNKADISEVKNFKTPPSAVKLTMEALCHFFKIKADKVKDPSDPTKKILDYWEPAKKLVLGDPDLLKNLKAYDKDNIDPKIIAKMQTFIQNPDFAPDVVKKASKAAYGLCCWCRAMVSYDKVAKVVAPKKEKLKEAEDEYAQVMVGLKGKQSELKKVEDKLAGLDAQLQGCIEKKKQLEVQIQDCIAKLDRAEKLITGLGGEKTRWTAEAERLGMVYDNLVSDLLLSAGVIAYLGAFTATFRKEAIHGWTESMSIKAGLQPSEDYSLTNALGNPVAIREWNIAGLPSDSFSVENGIVVSTSRRWPLMIDPQGQANVWVRNLEARNELVVIKLSDNDYLRQLELAIQFGKPALLENIGEALDAALEPVLLKQVFKKGGVMMMKLGEALVEYSDKFRFYMTTKLRNPHYMPEVSVKVTLLNFMITPIGLQDQMLGIVVAKERPELEEEKNRLILESAENKRQLKEIEEKILHVLSSSSGNILDDSSAIEVLTRSKVVSNEIAEKQVVADETEKRIDEARMGYVPVALRASLLFFCISDLANIEPTYQYSLTWYTNIFLYSIQNSDSDSVLARRIDKLCDYLTYMVYTNVCRSLFEKDKLLFSFLLATKILQEEHEGVVPSNEFRFFLTGGIASRDTPDNPQPDWLPDRSWGELHRLGQAIPSLEALSGAMVSLGGGWKAVYDDGEPHRAAFPGQFRERVTAFQRLCVIRSIRPDRLVPAIQDFVVGLQDSHGIMGQRFIEPPPFDLMGPFKESNSVTPLMFILSPGSDPMLTIYKFAEQQGIPIAALSLGQGQGPIAEKMVQKGCGDGSWVVLQNCHVYPSWMTTLERICEQMDVAKNHKQFRLWLTSYPSKDLPVAVLQNGVKLTNEPPKGLRANLLGSFMLDPISDEMFFEGCATPGAFKKLLFGLCFFHAIIQERRQFGPLGWNIPYEFNESDLRISVRQLQMFLNESVGKDDIPLTALTYITGQCNYGGRVTDPYDRTCMVAILETYYCKDILDDAYALSESGLYRAPEEGIYESYTEAIKALPINAAPDVFGMHANADITKDQGEAYGMLESIMTTQPRSSGGDGDGPEAVVIRVADDMLQRLPSNYDVEIIQRTYPVLYEESMNTVLCQELTRFNALLTVIRQSLTNVKKAIKGLVVMSASLDFVFNDAFDGKIPGMWKKRSYPSLKPLGSYFNDLLDRLEFFQGWVNGGIPNTFWLSGFFFTQSFLTGALQNYARAKTIPIDTVGFTFEFMRESRQALDEGEKPEFGVYTHGLYLEGARWDSDAMVLGESRPKELHTLVPVIWMRPWIKDQINPPQHYVCPLYKTSDRRGILSTTGHSTNFVMPIETPSNHDANHWIKRGAAMLTQLDD